MPGTEYLRTYFIICGIHLSLGILRIRSRKYSEHQLSWMGGNTEGRSLRSTLYISTLTDQSPSKVLAHSLQIIILTQILTKYIENYGSKTVEKANRPANGKA